MNFKIPKKMPVSLKNDGRSVAFAARTVDMDMVEACFDEFTSLKEVIVEMDGTQYEEEAEPSRAESLIYKIVNNLPLTVEVLDISLTKEVPCMDIFPYNASLVDSSIKHLKMSGAILFRFNILKCFPSITNLTLVGVDMRTCRGLDVLNNFPQLEEVVIMSASYDISKQVLHVNDRLELPNCKSLTLDHVTVRGCMFDFGGMPALEEARLDVVRYKYNDSHCPLDWNDVIVNHGHIPYLSVNFEEENFNEDTFVARGWVFYKYGVVWGVSGRSWKI
jgi:hypothetical protein